MLKTPSPLVLSFLLPLLPMLHSCKHLPWLNSQSKTEARAAAKLSSMPVFSHDIQFALKPFDSCKELTTDLREQVVKGINGQLAKRAEEYDPKNPDRGLIYPMASTAAMESSRAQTAGGDFTKTNNQVAGVEEGDVVVTDGEVIFQAYRHEVRRFGVDRDGHSDRLPPIVLDGEHYIHALALAPAGGADSHNQRLIVVSSFAAKNDDDRPRRLTPGRWDIGGVWAPDMQTVVSVYNLADEPVLSDRYQFSGHFSEMRLTGSVLRLLTKSSVQMGRRVETFVPNYDVKAKKHLSKQAYIAKTRATIAANIRHVQGTSDSVLLSGGYSYSGYKEGGKKGGALSRKTVPVAKTTDDCKRIYSNAREVGLYQQFTDVMSIELGTGEVSQDKFLVDSSDTYFTGRNLYLTHHSVKPAEPAAVSEGAAAEVPADVDRNERLAEGVDPNYTTVHKLAFLGLNSTHKGSLSIPGTLLNRYALSEYEDVLRMAVTQNRPIFSAKSGDKGVEGLDEKGRPLPPKWESESYVYTIGQNGTDALTVLGRVGGLGKNERIYSVRYFGDKGYVVTFRKTDPLYTLDLSDPKQPRVMGELKIPGFSTYMHGIGDGKLLAIGKDADLDGRVRGVKVSLFDVSDFAAPRLASELVLAENTYSEATYNPKAFNWNAPRRFLAIPMSYRYMQGKRRRNGDKIIGVLVDGGKLVRADDFGFAKDPTNSQSWLHMKRALMVGDALYTITEFGVKGYHYQRGSRAAN